MDASIAGHARHRVLFTHALFAAGNPLLDELLAGDDPGVRLAVFVDAGLASAAPGLPGEVTARLAACERFRKTPIPIEILPGGESAKNGSAVFEQALAAIHAARLCRRSYVLAIGGGAMLDVVGLAAAVAHRGVRLIRVASTTLGQTDSAIGVKNGINAFGVKNYMGMFAVPWAVVCDLALLPTLSDRDWRSGFSEAVKVAVLKDAAFFDAIAGSAGEIRQRDLAAAAPIIRRSAELHFDHIVAGGDPFEQATARPLDFGHWSAHRLEELSGFDVRHGEAVAIGVALDSLYAARIGLLSPADAERICACLEALGFELWHPLLERPEALRPGLEAFREHLGGRLTLTLPCGIGSTREVHEFDEAAFAAALAALRTRSRIPARV